MQKQPEKLLYTDFEKIILDFQLQEHEKFLKRFSEVFKQVDDTKRGVLDEDRFRSLLQMMNQACIERTNRHPDDPGANSAAGGGIITESNHDVIAPNLQLIGEGDEEITYLLQRIDPYNNNMINYSEVVQLLSSHMVPSDNPYE